MKARHGESAMEAALKMAKYRTSDQEQYERYKAVLGKQAPGSFADFQELKYKTPAEWGARKARYWEATHERSESRIFQDNAEARASDTFYVVPPTKGDAIKPQSLFKELQKSQIGKETYEYIITNAVNVEVNYTDDVEQGVRGYKLGQHKIFIYAKNTKTITLTAQTIIHEVAHIKLNQNSHTQWEEAYCFAQ